jgi:hypothetical protein
MVAPRSLGHHPASRREVLLLNLDELSTPYTLPTIKGRHFVCFCAMDAGPIRADDLQSFCSRLLQLGCAYLCAWGPDCERVHDIMDERVVGENPPESYIGCVMTTWHADESLEEALWFLLFCTSPDETYAADGCDVDLIISVGSGPWSAAIEQYVSVQIGPLPS